MFHWRDVTRQILVFLEGAMCPPDHVTGQTNPKSERVSCAHCEDRMTMTAEQLYSQLGTARAASPLHGNILALPLPGPDPV